jgi:hypothetical protein
VLLRRRWRSDGPEDGSVSRNLFPPVLGLAGIGLLACMVWALGLTDRELDGRVSHCASIPDEQERLACYDKLSTTRQPAKGAIAPIHIPQQEESP